MASGDWSLFNNSLSLATVDRGVTTGIPRPLGGGNFVYGFNSLALAAGASALFCNLVNFAPMAKGGAVCGAVQRGLSGGGNNFSPFLIIGAQGADINDNAYLFGLEDNEPHRLVLRKGRLSDGVPSAAPGSLGVLRRSTSTINAGTWVHLRLDMVVNLNGDVLLHCFQNDLALNPVTAPNWTAVPGMAVFIDDALGVNSGSAAYTSGRVGFGFASKDVARRGFFDQIEVFRQPLWFLRFSPGKGFLKAASSREAGFLRPATTRWCLAAICQTRSKSSPTPTTCAWAKPAPSRGRKPSGSTRTFARKPRCLWAPHGRSLGARAVFSAAFVVSETSWTRP